MLPPMVADQPSDKRVLRNYAFSIEEKRVSSATSPISVLTDLSVPEGPPKQVWKLVPVPGEEDVFFIQCADFEDPMVIESLDLSSGGTLVLSSLTGADIQKWRIGSTAAPNAADLKLADLTWAEWVDMSPIYAPWKWHWAHDVALKTGPNPSPVGQSGSLTVHTCVNSILPSLTAASSSALVAASERMAIRSPIGASNNAAPTA